MIDFRRRPVRDWTDDRDLIARSRPEKKPGPAPRPRTSRVFPIQLQIGDRITDETGEWEVIFHAV